MHFERNKKALLKKFDEVAPKKIIMNENQF